MKKLFHLSCGIVGVSLVLAALAGCEKRRETEPSVLADDESEFLLTVVVDLSQSCAPIMAENGVAFRFTMALLDKYFRSRIGSHDRLIVAQISNNDRPLLWEGEPLALRQEFGAAADFAQFLRENSDDAGSRVYTGVTKALEYAMSRQSRGNKKGATFILSDMMDYSDSSKADAQKMLKTIAEYCQSGSAVCFYYVDQSVAPFLEKHLTEMGVEEFRVETSIVGNPPLPNLE